MIEKKEKQFTSLVIRLLFRRTKKKRQVVESNISDAFIKFSYMTKQDGLLQILLYLEEIPRLQRKKVLLNQSSDFSSFTFTVFLLQTISQTFWKLVGYKTDVSNKRSSQVKGGPMSGHRTLGSNPSPDLRLHSLHYCIPAPCRPGSVGTPMSYTVTQPPILLL